MALFINPYPTDNPNPMILILIRADNESSKNFFPFPFFADSAIVEKASLTCHCTKNTIASSLFIIDLHCAPMESLPWPKRSQALSEASFLNLWCSGLARKVRSWHLASLHNSQPGNAGNAGKPMRENMTMITFGCLPYLSSGRSACHSPSITSVLSHFESFLVVEGIFI